MQRLRTYLIGDDPKVLAELRRAIQRSAELELINASAPLRAGDLLSMEEDRLLFVDLGVHDPSTSSAFDGSWSSAAVIAVGADPLHAVKAFELGAKDFLLIPFSFERFQKAVDRVLGGRRAHRNGWYDAIRSETVKELLLKSGKQLLKIDPGQIELVQSMGNYTKLHLTQGGHVLVNDTMAHMEEMLPANAFVRIHRSYIICLSSILAVGGNRIEWTGGDLTVGASYKKEALKKIDALLIGANRNKADDIAVE